MPGTEGPRSPEALAHGPFWQIYKRQPGMILGFHGCDRVVGNAVLLGREPDLARSTNDYDWLGDGIYFWEGDPWRAMDFALECQADKRKSKGRINDPYVIGAVIDPGHCCSLLEIEALEELKRAYEGLIEIQRKVPNFKMPKNLGAGMGLRKLDRAVIECMHGVRIHNELAQYDTVRSVFQEGQPLYENAGFSSKNHIQIAVRNPDCIKGYFRLPGLD